MSKAGARTPPVTRGDERWFLVHTRARSEHKAEHHLHAQGFGTYLPRIRKTVRHARRLTTVQAPAFPRYLFIVLDLGRDRWLSVSSTVGVSSLVSCNDRPVPVPVGIVETMIRQSNNDLTRLDANLMVGEKVRVLLGPFADLVGSLERLDDDGRVRVLLELMGSVVPIATHRSALAPAA
ncbi:MAG TPA: transcription termination/antitermination NusG family protein [Lacipirellulaceae bacterium]|nr:transcription termination/antitermination NusG family protein [Lacipirellulaceae bacterium]